MLCGCRSKAPVSQAASVAVHLPQAKLQRQQTAGTPLLAWLPSGADLVVELDLARVRANPVVGSLYRSAAARATGPSPVALEFDALRDADVVVIASYAVGTADAQTVTLLAGDRLPDPGELGTRLDHRYAAFGPPDLINRVEAARAGHGPTVAGDAVFMQLRDAAMPERGESASVRIAARLPFDARIGLAGILGLDAVPAGLSLWADVVDDLAVVALLSGEQAEEGAAMAGLVDQVRGQLAAHPLVRSWFLGHLVRAIAVEHRGNLARAVLVIPPRRLELVARRLNRQLSAR
jgi:hypothetical protein